MAQGSFRLHQADHVLTAIDARMGELYWAQYQRKTDGDWLLLGNEQVIAPDVLLANVQADTNTWLTAGTGWEAYPELLTQLPFNAQLGSVLYPDSQDMVYLAKYAFARGEIVTAEAASPIYLRDTVTWKKLPGRE